MKPTQSQLSRRSFLSATAAATASFAIMDPARVRGSQANAKITAGIVGLGGRGAWIANHVATQPGYQVTAVADYFPAVAQEVGEKLGVPRDRRYFGLDGYRRLLASKVDAIFLETPPYFFPAHAQAAVEAGCHVYMAKPVAVDVPGTLQILEAGRQATRRKQVFLVDFQTRTDEFHIEAIKRVREGMIGKVGLLTSFYHDECFGDPKREKTIANLLRGLAWVNDTALGGSYIVNCDIHAIDVALWIAGELPVSAFGYSARHRPNAQGDSHDCYAITFKFPNGLVLSNQSEHIRNGSGFKSGCHAYGEKAFLESNYGGKVFVRGLEDVYPGGENRNLYADGMMRNVEAFRKAIVEGRHDNPTLESSVNSTLATLLGRNAALEHREISWTALLADNRRLEVDLSGLQT